MPETRKVQHVGLSTLTVSLPRDWARQVGLNAGDIVSFEQESDGSLRLFPGSFRDEKKEVRCLVDADAITQSGLLTRIITGAYIIGHDTVQIRSKKELTALHLEEVRSTIRRLTGVSIVEQTISQVTIQSFLDPTRFPVYGLVKRLCMIITSMLDAVERAFMEDRRDLASEVSNMEDEADKIYWLIVRQLLLAARFKAISSKIGITSPLHVSGNRAVAKVLENIADYAEVAARDVLHTVDKAKEVSPELREMISSFMGSVRGIFEDIVKAFFTIDLKLANDSLERIRVIQAEEARLARFILSSFSKTDGPSSESSIVLAVSLRSLVRSLAQMAKYCGTIAEVVINRSLESSSRIFRFEEALSSP